MISTDTFNEEMKRAKAIVAHAKSMTSCKKRKLVLAEEAAQRKSLQSDLYRSAWMFAVGAADAFFCDARTELLTATLIAKSRQPEVSSVELLATIDKLPIPASVVFEALQAVTDNRRPNWKFRMAVRSLMEIESALSVEKIKVWYNPFLLKGTKNRKGAKLFQDVLQNWCSRSGATNRLFGRKKGVYDEDAARKQFSKRLSKIFQRRHDLIHCCDRPKNEPQPIKTERTVSDVIRDLTFVVENTKNHLNTEFKNWLKTAGFSAQTINAVKF